MSKKHFSWLAGLTVLAALIAFLVPSQTAKDNGFVPAPLLPALESQVNGIGWLRISAEGGVVATARRADDRWVIEEAAGYVADWPRLQALLSGLAGAEVTEAKTANPDYYARLGVADTSSPGAAGALIEFEASAGLPAVIVGNAAQGRGGQYVRLADSAQSVLIDRELDIPRETAEWLDRSIIDISAEEVVEAAVTHADGEAVVLKKVSADDENFELQAVPEGFEPKSDWAVNALASGLSALELDAVAREADIDWSESATYRLVTADGLDITAEIVVVTEGEDEGESRWIRLEAGLYTTAVGGTKEDAEGETAARAADINGRVSGWAYRIPNYKFDTMNKRMDDLTQEAEAPE